MKIVATSKDFGLPSGLELPAPWSPTDIKSGKSFCFHGVIKAPTTCGSDPLCGMMAKRLAQSDILMKACHAEEKTKFTFDLASSLPFTEAGQIVFMTLSYQLSGSLFVKIIFASGKARSCSLQ